MSSLDVCQMCGGTQNLGMFGVCYRRPECEAEDFRRLIRNAPDTRALEALWEHRQTAWTEDLNRLAVERRRELEDQRGLSW